MKEHSTFDSLIHKRPVGQTWRGTISGSTEGRQVSITVQAELPDSLDVTDDHAHIPMAVLHSAWHNLFGPNTEETTHEPIEELTIKVSGIANREAVDALTQEIEHLMKVAGTPRAEISI